MRAALAVSLLLTLSALLAGCNGGKPGGGGTGLVDDDEFDGLDPTADTGIIRGVVVDEAVRPIAGATIAITGGAVPNATSADSGAFGFEGLAPGTYFLEVGKAGYQSVQVSAEVKAGVADPELTKVLLVADPSQAPYYVPYYFEGFIGCSARYFIEGRNFCGGINEQDETVFDIEDLAAVPTFAQGELVWDSTQSLGDELSFNWRRDDTSRDYIDIEGASPLILRANQTLLLEEEVGLASAEDGPQPLRSIVFTAHNQQTEPPCLPEDIPEVGGCNWGVGVQVNQQFALYIHVFYNMVPPEDWTFGEDGDPPVPS